jgi:methyl-accepting chemotaxis protein
MLRLSIARKLALAFGAVVVLIALVLVLASGGLSRLSAQSQESAQRVPRMDRIGQITTGVRQYRVAQLERTLAPEAADRQELRDEERDVAKRIDALIATTARGASSPAEKAAITRTAGDWRRYQRATSSLASVTAARGPASAYSDVLNGPADGIYDALTGDVAAVGRVNLAATRELAAEVQAHADATRNRILVVLVLSLLVALTACALVTRSIRGSAKHVLDRLSSLDGRDTTELDHGVRALAAGDLTRDVQMTTEPIARPGADELGDIARATNGIRDRIAAIVDSYNSSRQALSEMVSQVADGADAINGSSQQMATISEEAGRAVGEIASAVGEVAQGAERQVQAIADAQGIAEQVVSVTQRSAGEASTTAEVAGQARALAGEGAQAIVGATEAMGSVRESSRGATEAIRALDGKSAQIGTIVDTITAIAEQTNLLALNAAIEAARAGDHGRGFAVVAEEVRKLAEESESAARSIATLIGEIQTETSRAVQVVEEGARRTEQGAEVVQGARTAFEQIGSSVEDVTTRVDAIAAAVAQIAASAQEMSDRMTEVASVAEQSSASSQQVSATTQQTSASTQEIAASAQDLARTAGGLQELVTRFTVATAA